MKVGYYLPNKPLVYQTPSGDRTISEQLIAAFSIKGHKCREMSSFRSRWFWLDGRKLLQLPVASVYALKNFRDFRPDMWLTYHSYYKSPDVLGWWISQYVGNIKFVMFQTMYSTKRKKRAKTKLGYLLNTIALKKADMIFLNNYCDINDLLRIVPKEKVMYIPPGIYPEHFRFSAKWREVIRSKVNIAPEDLVLITVARFRRDVKWVSMQFLLQSLSLIKKEFPFKLMIIGSGPLEFKVRQIATRLLGSSVIFIGEVERRHLYKYYSAADLFVFPGIGESLGMVYLEAQSCGIPVVALEGPGVKQVIEDGKTGILVKSRNVVAYAEAVARLCRQYDMMREMGNRAREYVENRRNAHKNLGVLVSYIEEMVKN